MKTLLLKARILFLFLLGLMLQQTMVFAQSYELQPADVTIVGGVITACSYDFTSGSTDIIIPADIGGETIIGIGEGVFLDKGLTSVALPATLQSIGKEAFRKCPLTTIDFSNITGDLDIGEASFRQGGLTSLTLGANIKSVELNAFRDNSNLTSVTFANENLNLKVIGSGAFRGTSSLTSIVIPSYIETIESNAFYLGALTTLTFDSGSLLKTIESGAFDGFSGSGAIATVVIPASVETIGSKAFRDNALTSVTFEDGSKLKFIDATAFSGNADLASIVLPASTSDGQDFIHWLTSTGNIINGNESVSDFEISYTAVFVNKPDCPDCYTLTAADVTIVDGVITACSYDFTTGNTDIIIPPIIGGETIIGIAEGVFKETGLTSVYLPATLQFIGKEVFRKCLLTSIDFSHIIGDLEIGEASFRQCDLTSLTLGGNIKSVELNAFRDNSNLTAVTFANENLNLKVIGSGAFRGTSSLTSIVIPSYIETVESNAFYLGALTTLTFEEGSSLVTIESGAFDGYDGAGAITTVFIPASVESIGSKAFRDNALTSVTFEEGSKLKFIDATAFSGNAELTSIVLPASYSDGQDFIHWITSAGNIVKGNEAVSDFDISYTAVFVDKPDCPECYTLTAADVTIVDGIITDCSYDVNHQSIIIPNFIDGNMITGIGESVFYSDTLLSIYLPATLTYIGKEAFRKSPLDSIDFSPIIGELEIGEAAFRDCSIDTLFIGENVKTISLNAFRNNNMKSLVFADNCIVDSIAEAAFRYNLLTSVTIPGSLRYIGDRAFNINGLTELNFESNSSLGIIGNEAFDGALKDGYDQSNKITEILFPASLERINNRAFRNNVLTSVVFETGSMLKTLEPEVFIENDPALEIQLPALDAVMYDYWLSSDGTQYEGGATINDFAPGYDAVSASSEDLIIYVSQSEGDDTNDGSSSDAPVKSLLKAKELADAQKDNADYIGYQILLKGGDVFDELTSMTSDALVDDDADRSKYAFVWDINKTLLLSTYGSEEKATIYSGKYTSEGGPQGAVAVCKPSEKEVIIENIHIKRFQANAFLALETSNVIFRNNKVEEIGTFYFPGETGNPDIFCAGVFYVRNSSNVKALNNEFIDMHNAWIKDGSATEDNIVDLHAFYLTRLTGGEIANNIVRNTSGPPLKFRRALTNNIHVHNNEFYYTGPSIQMSLLKGFAQTGWVRYSGDSDGGCPYAITIEDNIFHYPYCWEEYEDCEKAVAEKYSISNTNVCGADAVEDPEKVLWVNNDFIYGNEVSVEQSFACI